MNKIKKVGIVGFLIATVVLLSSLAYATPNEKRRYSKNVFDNEPPVADAGGPYFGRCFEWITLDGSKSYDPDGKIVGYRWILKGLIDTGWVKDPIAKIKISSKFTGFLTITLIVKDNNGATDSDVATLVLPKPPIYIKRSLSTKTDLPFFHIFHHIFIHYIR